MTTCRARGWLYIVALLGTTPVLLRCGSNATDAIGGAGASGAAAGSADAGTEAATGGQTSGMDAGEAAGQAGDTVVSGARISVTPNTGVFAGAIGVKVPPSTFTVTNTGGAATGALTVSLSGAGFTLSADQCSGKVLAAGATCTVGVGFFSTVAVPTVTGELDVSADPGGSAMVELSGSAVVAAHLNVAPDTGSSTAFGDVQIGAPKIEHFIVSNSGMQTTSPIQIDVTGDGFSVSPTAGTGCIPGSTALVGGATCTLDIVFAPSAHGPASGSLAVSASTGGTPTPISLTANGLVPPTITVDTSSKDFGILEVGVATAPLTLTFSNTGDVATGTITRSSSSELTAGSGCATIAAHSSCTIPVTFKAADSGLRAPTLTLSGAAGGTFTFKATADARYRLTISRPGAAAGHVLSSPAGIDCSAAGAATCSALFVNGPVALTATTTNGGNAFFSGWSGGGCAGPFGSCTVAFSSATTVVATFTPMTNNLIFVTHDSFSAALGSVTAYDTKCNAAATAAGLNNVAGNAFVAYVSSPASLASARLGSARGWVRRDARPFADTLTAAYSSGQVFNSIQFDEYGQAASMFSPLTGTQMTGILGDSCTGWTSTAGNYTEGDGHGGPWVWGGVFSGDLPCSGTAPVICMGNTKTAAVAVPALSGRKIWLTTTNYVIGSGMTPDQKCQSERAAGVTTAVALIAYDAKPASAVLTAGQNYLRPDGTLVGTGAELASGSGVESGVWQSAGGTYEFTGAWTGSSQIGALGTGTCGDWTSTVGTGIVGATNSTALTFWWSNSTPACNGTDGWRLYCVQTAP